MPDRRKEQIFTAGTGCTPPRGLAACPSRRRSPRARPQASREADSFRAAHQAPGSKLPSGTTSHRSADALDLRYDGFTPTREHPWWPPP